MHLQIVNYKLVHQEEVLMMEILNFVSRNLTFKF